MIVLTKGGPSNSTKLVLYYIFEQAHENFAAGKAAAASLLSVSFLLALSVVSLKTMERGRACGLLSRRPELRYAKSRRLRFAHARCVDAETRSLALRYAPAGRRCAAPASIIAGLMVVTAFLWSTPFLWTLVASFRPEMAGGIGMASLVPDYVPTLANFRLAFESGDFAVLLPQHRDRGLRHPGGADRDHLAGGLRLRPPLLPGRERHLLRLPAPAHAGAADPDRAQPAHRSSISASTAPCSA